MAMDKDRLIQYFLTHYVSRQEVLFKLPLSISIDSFWPELMNRRKAGASVLSLYDHLGRPYWYVLTDKMISASERLCEEAMNQDERFDPYRAPMTSAMTEEMFFTSFVEGAQIPLQEAMDFLGRGTEPENVQEQMIWNNRQAWSAMVKALYKPLDESFVKSLAFMLTDEMEGRADDYRLVDNHPIAAMHTEHYEVPSAVSIPERMHEYYGFLQTASLHPLVKAAVGQAFLLTTRPFPEGNERLSRMISSAVLLRSGYDFFRDISISSLIARENYRYYKAMCEILRPENGSDLTYFIEYYIDLLARALADKKEREKRRIDDQQKEALEHERQMAHQPLGMVTLAPQSHSVAPKGQNEPQARDDTPHETEATESPPSTERQASIQAALHDLMTSFSTKTTERKSRIVRTLTSFLMQGICSFSRAQWQTASSIAQGTASDDCCYMLKNGIIAAHRNGIFSTYTLTEKVLVNQDTLAAANDYAPMRYALLELQQTGTDREKRIALQVLQLLDQGITRFSSAEWGVHTGLNKSVNNDDLRTAANHGLIELTDNGYRICERVDQEKRFSTPTPMIRDAVSKLLSSFADRPFLTSDAAKQMNVKANTAAYCLEQLMQKGILKQERCKSGQRAFLYTFTKDYLARRQAPNVPVYPATSSSPVNCPGVAAAGRSSPPMRL